MQNLPFFTQFPCFPSCLASHVRHVYGLTPVAYLPSTARVVFSMPLPVSLLPRVRSAYIKYNKCTRARRFDLYQEWLKSSIKLRSFLSKRLREWKIRRTFAPANEERGLLGNPRRRFGPAFCD